MKRGGVAGKELKEAINALSEEEIEKRIAEREAAMADQEGVKWNYSATCSIDVEGIE